MARIEGIIGYTDLAHLSAEQRAGVLENKHQELAMEHGPGVFEAYPQTDGTIRYQYDYAEGFTQSHRPHGEASLSEDQIKAICHGRTALGNLGGTYMRGDEWVGAASHADDPAIPARVKSLNTLEQLLAPLGHPSRPELATAP